MGFILFFLICIFLIWAIHSFEVDKKNTNTESNNAALKGFNYGITKKVGNHTFLFSKDYKEMAIRCDGRVFGNNSVRIIDVDSLIGCEVFNNNVSVKKHTIGRAVVGGVLAGGVGALIGAGTAKTKEKVESIDLKFMTDNIKQVVIHVKVYQETLDSGINSDTVMEQCDELVATINLIIDKK